MYTEVQNQLRQIAENYASRKNMAFDYANGAVLGALAQQGINAVTDGVDPNPLVSGLLYAPIYRGNKQLANASTMALSEQAFKTGKGVADLDLKAAATRALEKYAYGSPIEASLTAGSYAASLGNAGTSAYNLVTSGEDIDNNIPAGLTALAAIAPTAFYLLRNRSKNNIPF
jgi:hypothetical protein